eukprot:5222749-Pleurochrysis_carterae.AAC.5
MCLGEFRGTMGQLIAMSESERPTGARVGELGCTREAKRTSFSLLTRSRSCWSARVHNSCRPIRLCKLTRQPRVLRS